MTKIQDAVVIDPPKTLVEKISAITHKIGGIKKEKKQGSTVPYAFRGIDEVMNRLNPLLAEYGVTMQSTVVSHTMTRREYVDQYGKPKVAACATVHLRLMFSDGEGAELWEEVAMSEDSGDKALTQAMTMAYKYAITRKFCIMTEDTIDPDGIAPDTTTGKSTAAPAKPAAPAAKPAAKAAAPAAVIPPAEKPWLEKDSKSYLNCIEAIENGQVTLDRVKKKYQLSVEVEKNLKAITPKTA